jgi:hypothetical protein
VIREGDLQQQLFSTVIPAKARMTEEIPPAATPVFLLE